MSGMLDVRTPTLPDTPSQWPVVDAETLALLRPAGGIFTPAQDRLLRRIAASRWFLLRNTGPQGEVWRCGRMVGGVKCGAIHPYFTLHCRPRPFNGLTHALGILKERVGPEVVWSALELGAVEPISRDYALRLYEDLRGLGYARDDLLGGVLPARRR